MAAVGSAIIPSMIREGYSPPFSAALTACAATMGAIVPPSVAMILIAYIYGGQGTINVPSWSPDGTKIAFVSNTQM